MDKEGLCSNNFKLEGEGFSTTKPKGGLLTEVAYVEAGVCLCPFLKPKYMDPVQRYSIIFKITM